MTNKEALVLQLLSGSTSPMFGLELVEKSNGMLSRWGIYQLLAGMEDAGYVLSSKEDLQKGENRLPRRKYIITEGGRFSYTSKNLQSGQPESGQCLAVRGRHGRQSLQKVARTSCPQTSLQLIRVGPLPRSAAEPGSY